MIRNDPRRFWINPCRARILWSTCIGSLDVVVDPAIHNSNTRRFRGSRLRTLAGNHRIDEEIALEAVRDFIVRFGAPPTAASWAAAGMTPSEKTIRRRFGSFRAALEAAGLVAKGSSSADARSVPIVDDLG